MFAVWTTLRMCSYWRHINVQSTMAKTSKLKSKCLIYIGTKFLLVDWTHFVACRLRWPRGLRRGFLAARLLVWFRIPPVTWMSVSIERCVLSRRISATGRSLTQRRPTECVLFKSDFENLTMRRPEPSRAVES